MDVLDHSHEHGFVRGVLCRNCNAMEGKVSNLANRAKRGGTRLEWLKRLVKYLEKHDTPQTMYVHHLHKTKAEKDDLRRKRMSKKAALKKLTKKAASD